MNFKTNLLRVLPAGVVLLGASMAHAQSLVTGSTLNPDGATFGGVTVTTVTASVDSLPLALPTAGNFINFAVTDSNLFKFTGLPATGNATSSSLNATLGLKLDNLAFYPLTFPFSYTYDADATQLAVPGTQVFFNPSGGAQTFTDGGQTYSVTLNLASAFTAADPTEIGITSVTGKISNITSSAPEPGTLVLAGLGIAGLAARRRRK